MTMATAGKQLASRMVRASLTDTELYVELARDAGAIRQSVLAVLIVAVAWGSGSAVDYLLDGDIDGAIVGFLVTGLWALLFWVPFSGFAFVITRIMAKIYEVDIAQVSYPQFVRSVGFVATPGCLGIDSICGTGGSAYGIHVDGSGNSDRCCQSHPRRVHTILLV